jgi:transcriptional regulator with XRE-family HTH domain
MGSNMLGDMLKTLRAEKGVGQDELAQMLNIKRQTYGAYERGVSLPDVNTLATLADYFGVTTDYLLNRENPDNSYSIGDVSGSAVINENNNGSVAVHDGDEPRRISAEATELLRIYESLDIRVRVELLQTAWNLEKKNAESQSDNKILTQS